MGIKFEIESRLHCFDAYDKDCKIFSNLKKDYLNFFLKNEENIKNTHNPYIYIQWEQENSEIGRRLLEDITLFSPMNKKHINCAV